MKYIICFSFLLFCSSSSFAQSGFQEGYFIDLEGEKHEVFILNKDWKNNPSEFKYKVNLDAKPQVKKITETKEFSIIGKSVYQRHVVNIDRSDTEIK